jgi:predicted nucleotidyltransferase
MAIQLNETEKTTIKNILKSILPNVQFKIFGSRAKGTAKKYSDLDLVLITETPVSLAKLSELEEEFANSDIPFKIDIVDWQRITPEFKKIISDQWKDI